MQRRNLRVVFLAHIPGLGGGADELLLELVTALFEREACSPLVVVPDEGELAARLSGARVPVVRADYGWWCTRRPSMPRRAATLVAKQGLHTLERTWVSSSSVATALADFSPNLIVSNTNVIGAGAIAAARMRVPHIWLAQEYGRADFGFEFFLGYGASMRLLGACSARVLAISHALGAALKKYVRPSKIEVVHGPSLVPPGSALSGADASSPLRLILLGRGVPGKGTEDAIRATGIARESGVNVELRVVGTNEGDLNRLRDTARREGAGEAVEIVGRVPDPIVEIDRAHVGLTCSRQEAFGRVTVEYLKRGRPVIGTASGGTPELIEEGVTGLLYEPGNTQELADRIGQLASSRATVSEMSQAALDRNAGRFLIADYADIFRGTMERACSAGPANGVWSLLPGA
jgi:glycosyltransferase involved in cell wall biosynthesis